MYFGIGEVLYPALECRKIEADLERLEVGLAAGQSTKTGFVKFENPSRAQPAAITIIKINFRRRENTTLGQSKERLKPPKTSNFVNF